MLVAGKLFERRLAGLAAQHYQRLQDGLAHGDSRALCQRHFMELRPQSFEVPQAGQPGGRRLQALTVGAEQGGDTVEIAGRPNPTLVGRPGQPLEKDRLALGACLFLQHQVEDEAEVLRTAQGGDNGQGAFLSVARHLAGAHQFHQRPYRCPRRPLAGRKSGAGRCRRK